MLRRQVPENLELPIERLPPADARIGSGRALHSGTWRRFVRLALLVPILVLVVPLRAVRLIIVGAWRFLRRWHRSDRLTTSLTSSFIQAWRRRKPPAYASELRDGYVYWYENGRHVATYKHLGSPADDLPRN